MYQKPHVFKYWLIGQSLTVFETVTAKTKLKHYQNIVTNSTVLPRNVVVRRRLCR